MNASLYLIQVNIYLILFYGFYRLLLRNETFHGKNRLFLVGGAVLSLIIPVWQFDWVQQLFLTEQVSEAVVYYMAPMQVVAIRPQAKPITWADLCFWVYVSGSFIFCIRFIINVLNLRKLLIGGVMAFRAFTFGRRIYIDQNLPESQTILKHETVHAQQLHSFDVVFFEILLIINWFNPILYAYRQSIKNIHEFLADEVAAHEFGKANYARLLLSQEFGVSPSIFTTQFFDQSSLKQRIIMLAKPKSKKAALLKYGLSMPLFIAMLIVSSAFVAKNSLKVIDISKTPASLAMQKQNSAKQIFEIEKTDKNGLKDVDKKIKILNDEDLKSVANLANIGLESLKNIDKLLEDSTKIIFTGKEGDPQPLFIVIEGIKTREVYNSTFANINPNDIRTMTVLKGNEAIQKYGDKGKNGVIEITMKLSFDKKQNELNEIVVVGLDNKGNSELEQGEEVFETVEEMAEFPGGIREAYKYLAENIKYPAEAQKAKTQGKVFLAFVIKKDGTIKNIKILKGIGSGCDEEAIRVVKAMPKWAPAKQNGKIVNSSFTLPISFMLE